MNTEAQSKALTPDEAIEAAEADRKHNSILSAAYEMMAELEHIHGMLKHYLKAGYLPHLSAEEAEQVVRNPDSALRKARGER